jgi:hypothetical protein
MTTESATEGPTKAVLAATESVADAHNTLLDGAELLEVAVVRGVFQVHLDRLASVPDVERTEFSILQPKHRFSVTDDHKGLLCGSLLTVVVMPPGMEPDAERALIEVTAEYLLTYNLSDGADTLPEKAFQVFAANTGVFNAWPFFREFVRSSTDRMSIPPLILPLMKMPPRPPKRVTSKEKAVKAESKPK